MPLLFFHRSLFLGQAFLPADLLGTVAPWRGASHENVPQAAWNVLRFDGIAQFYPWRLQTASAFRAGHIPLWNPYAFAGQGGTPLLANSQSAPLYPPNLLLFTLLPTWYAFGIAAALHLLIAAAGMYAFLRGVPVARAPALLGAVAFSLSGPIVTWLALPTFLAVACWLPTLLLLIRHAHHAPRPRARAGAMLGAGGVAGLMLLAGHLQVAFYCLLTAGLYAAWHGLARDDRLSRRNLLRWLTGMAAAGIVAGMLAAPQVLPAVELSRVSHRVGAPTMAGYAAYSSNALPPRNAITLLAPDFFGHPNAGTYWNTNRDGIPVNYAEWALYVGVLPLALAAYALLLPWRGGGAEPLRRERTFWALLAALGLAMALGTLVNLPFFFGVPGFSQTGSPARSLLLVSFALSVLAALGLEALRNAPDARDWRRGAAAIALPLLLASLGASAAARWAQTAVPVPFSDLMTLAAPGLLRAMLFLLLAAGLILITTRLPAPRREIAAVAAVGIAAADLLGWGIGYNPTAPPAQVYPATPGIRWLQTNAGDALIAPLNRGWSLSARPPQAAALPPNALTVFGLHDVGGYDSLFPGRYKREIAATGGVDPSPPENGNMVFVKSTAAARALSARFIVVAPAAAALAASDPALRPVYVGDDLIIFENPAGRSAPGTPAFAPVSFRVGLFLGLCGIAIFVAAGGMRVAGLWRRRE